MKKLKPILLFFALLLFVAVSLAQTARFDENGNLGIGTLSPTEKLDIVGNATVRGGTFAVGKEAGAADVRFKLGLNRTADGNAFFDIVSDASAYPAWGARFIRFADGVSRFVHRGTANFEFNTSDGADLCLNTNNAVRIKIEGDDGDVGIGTNTPAVKLDVAGSATVRGNELIVGSEAGSGDAHIEIGKGRTVNGNAFIDLIGDVSAYSDFGARFSRFVNGDTRFDHKGEGTLQFRVADNGQFQIQTNSTGRLWVKADGKVGIGTDSPTDTLTVNGSASKPGGGDWATFSDKRLKKNIHPFTDGLEQVLAINPVKYQYNGKGGITDTETEFVGVVAQEVEKVAPYMVEPKEYVELAYEGEDETYREYVKSTESYLSVNATAIRYMLVNAVKEQQGMILEQREMIAHQEQEIALLKKQLNMLEALVGQVIDKSGPSETHLQAAELPKIKDEAAALSDGHLKE